MDDPRPTERLAPGGTGAIGRERRLFDLLTRAGDLPDAEREALLAAADPALAAEVRELLAADRDDDRFLRTAPLEERFGAVLAADAGEAALEPGTRIGPYRVIELLGCGGMGHVYLAEQREPIERRVALKLLRVSLIDSEARRRFVAERRAMARLDHPNVGKILDAGTTPDGTPYLAMERIDGEPITDYCDRRELPVADRLRLFAQVCRGVDHAHGKLLLHRDVKPSNVLVAEVDGEPVPKLIDFGIAKILDASASGGLTLHQLLGTPRYMSPEALGLSRPGDGGPGADGPADLDTRSDVFSLGVLLHELLTGSAPWEGDGVSLADVLQRRTRDEPRRPSAAFTGRLEPARVEAARRRGATAPVLARHLRGDLDWIVLRAVAADPAERYGSAAELAADVERHLADRPVEARPPSRAYVLRKALRRHRGAALAAGLVLAALTLGIAGTSLASLRARRAEEHARAEAAAAEEARIEAERVVDFLTGIFAASGVESPETTRPPTEMTALEMLDRGAERVERDLDEQPRVQARLALTIGTVYQQLGLYDRSLEQIDRAVAVIDRLDPPEPRLRARALGVLASTYLRQARTEEAGRVIEQALEIVAGSEDRADRTLAAGLSSKLGRQRRMAGDFEAAEEAQRRAAALHLELDGPDSSNAASDLSNLGHTFFVQQRWADAEEQFRRSLEILRRTLPPGHARLAVATDNLAAAVASQGRLEEAAPIFAEALAEKRRLLGDEHPSVADNLNNLGVLERDLGRLERSEAYHREALAIRERQLGPDHPATAWSLDNLARTLTDLGRAPEALALQTRALSIRERHHGPDHLEVRRSLAHLADLALTRGEPAAARPLAERALAISRARLAPGDEQIGDDSMRLGEAFRRLGDRAAARARFDEAIAIFEAGGQRSAEELEEARRAIERLEAEGGEER